MNTKHIGTIAEMALAICFAKKGYTVSVPWGENTSYDLIIDDGTKFTRVQCKIGRYTRGSILASVGRVFYDKATKGFSRRQPETSKFDAYGIYCPELDKCYLVPVVQCNSVVSLRVDELHPNGRSQRWAKDFELEGKEIKLISPAC